MRVDESWRNGGHAQLIAGFQAQTFGDCAHGVLGGGIDRHGRSNLNSGRGDNIYEMSKTLPPKNRQGGGDAVKNTLEGDDLK